MLGTSTIQSSLQDVQICVRGSSKTKPTKDDK